MDVQTSKSTRIIRALNNHCRATFTGCQIMMTAAVAALDADTRCKVLEAVRDFDAFDEGNDPHNEADMAFFEVDGERYFWKFDYYDMTMTMGSDDPSDVTKTRRVLTVGFASDY